MQYQLERQQEHNDRAINLFTGNEQTRDTK